MANNLARSFRKNPTPAEHRLWQELRQLRTSGYHFRRQVPIEGFVVDFACLSHRLIVEVDGNQHLESMHVQTDAKRDAHLRWCGFSVSRFTNAEVLTNAEGVMTSVLLALGVLESRE
jgi:very-short-patch-repair endonuclease